MKTAMVAILMFGTTALKALAVEVMPANPADTIFILLKNDNKFRNEIVEGVYAQGYTVYGFVRNGKPCDFLDSLGYLSMSIYLSKDTLAVYEQSVCLKKFTKKTISLYDLRDSLKANMDINYYRKRRLNVVYRPEDMAFDFRVNAGLPSSAKPLEGWEAPNIGIRGHFVGHYLA